MSDNRIEIKIPVPQVKPPVFDKNFVSDAAEDITIIITSPATYPLAAAAAASGMSLGANDFANSMGTTVGAGVLSLQMARFIGGSAAIYGATFGGKETAATIKKGIFDISKTTLDADATQNTLAYAIAGAALWVAHATRLNIPVSTTHSAVGGLAGVGLTAEAMRSNDFGDLGKGLEFGAIKNIAKSWVLSPVAGALTSVLIYTGVRPLYKYTQFVPGMQYIWNSAQILSSASVAYTIGRNDVGNFVGPVAGGIDAAKHKGKGLAQTADVNQWLRMAGGMLILVGMTNFGRGVTNTIGSGIAELNVAKAFSAELGTALVVDYFSDNGQPISTSHTIMGSVVGIAILTAANTIPWRFLAKIGKAWIYSVPVSAILAGGAYTVVTSVSNINRDAPALPDHDAGALESAAVASMRTGRLMRQAEAKVGGRIAGVLGLGAEVLGAYDVSSEGPNPLFASAAEFGTELLPVFGGVAQAANGFYGLVNGRSWWTNCAMGRWEAGANILMGVVFTLLDVLTFGVLGTQLKLLRLIPKAGRAVEVANVARTARETQGILGRTVGRMRGAMARQAEFGAQVAQMDRFVEGQIGAAVRTVNSEVARNRVTRTLLRGGVEGAVERGSQGVIKTLAVQNGERLLNEMLADVVTSAPARERVVQSIEAASRSAHKKKNYVILERAARRAMVREGISRGTAKGFLKSLDKQIPRGTLVLMDEAAKASYTKLVGETTQAAVATYQRGFRRYFSMGTSALLEPLTLKMTTGLIGKGLTWLKNRSAMQGSFKFVRNVGHGWLDTVNPLR